MFKHRGIIFVIGLVVGVAAALIFRERRTAEIPLTPTNGETVSPATTPISTTKDDDLRELLRLRGEVGRLRRENSELQRASSAPSALDRSAPNERRPTFRYSFLTRDTWTNVGLATPAAAIQTFFSAFANGDEAVLARVSSLQPNGEPFVLTGMSTDWAERVMGVQILSSNFDPKDPDVRDVRILTETRNASDAGEVLTHNVVTFRLRKDNGEWRFAGKVR
jgi:hypothetical protein